MKEIFVAFRSRSQAMRFFEAVSSYRLPSRVVNMPKEAGVGCGLSVKMLARDVNRAKIVLSRGDYSSFIGIYAIADDGKTVKIA